VRRGGRRWIKAVSPVMSALLLLGVTASMAIVLWFYSVSWGAKTSENINRVTNLNLMKVLTDISVDYVYVDQSGSGAIWITNNGKHSVKILDIKIYDASNNLKAQYCEKLCSPSLITIDANSSETISLPTPSTSYSKGEVLVIRIYYTYPYELIRKNATMSMEVTVIVN